jgi:hypothetical protein
MATKAAELVSAYGDISNAPGRRCQAQTIQTLAAETSAGITGATTVEDAYDAIFDIVLADRAITTNSIGRATSVEVVQGVILTVTLTDGGTGYDPGTYTAVPLTGGTGTGAEATIVVGVGGDVTSVTITDGGAGYDVGEVLSADDGDLGGLGGSDLEITVATTSGPINA